MAAERDLPPGLVFGIALVGVLGSLLMLLRLCPLVCCLGKQAGTRVRCSLLVAISCFELVLSLCNCASALHGLFLSGDDDICDWVAGPLTFSVYSIFGLVATLCGYIPWRLANRVSSREGAPSTARFLRMHLVGSFAFSVGVTVGVYISQAGHSWHLASDGVICAISDDNTAGQAISTISAGMVFLFMTYQILKYAVSARVQHSELIVTKSASLSFSYVMVSIAVITANLLRLGFRLSSASTPDQVNTVAALVDLCWPILNTCIFCYATYRNRWQDTEQIDRPSGLDRPRGSSSPSLYAVGFAADSNNTEHKDNAAWRSAQERQASERELGLGSRLADAVERVIISEPSYAAHMDYASQLAARVAQKMLRDSAHAHAILADYEDGGQMLQEEMEKIGVGYGASASLETPVVH